MTLDLLCHEFKNIDWNSVINCTNVDKANTRQFNVITIAINLPDTLSNTVKIISSYIYILFIYICVCV